MAHEKSNIDARMIVVFVHGLGGKSDQWEPIRSAMVSGLPSLTIDLAGHGHRRAVPGPYTLARFADDLVAELQRLPDAQFILVGHSLGGAVCAEVARALPDQVRHVLAVESLVSPVLYPRLGRPVVWLYRGALTYAFTPSMRALLRLSHTAGTPQWVKDEADEELLGLRRTVAREATLSLAKWDRDAVLAQCHATTFVAFPAADMYIGPRDRAGIGAIEVRPVGAGGHYYFKVMPELVASLIDTAVGEASDIPV